MEDLFELAVALAVIILPLMSKKKKKQQRPGKAPRREAPKPAAKPEQKSRLEQWLETVDDEDDLKPELGEALSDIAEKAEKWIAGAQSAGRKNAHMQPQRLQAERLEAQKLEPEPLIPVAMDAPLMQEADMGEGQSHMDDAGCVGGSMQHEADDFHQGMDFHPHGEHSFRRDAQRSEDPPRVERVQGAISAADLRRAVILSEILDRPVSMRE